MDEIHKNDLAIDETEQCRVQLANAEERIKYLYADFENFRRNTEKERSIWVSSAQARVLTDLLTVVDNFERAISELGGAVLTESERVRLHGFELIYKELGAVLNRYGVTEIPVNIPFDPEKHEALVQIDVSDKTTGQIVAVLQKGYLFKDTVLRPAKVSVAK